MVNLFFKLRLILFKYCKYNSNNKGDKIKMKALLFPGQGSQIVGMGKELHDKFDLVKRLFDEADNKLKL